MRTPPEPPSIDRVIREMLRLTSGSGEELAQQVGVSYASLYAWSRARRRPSRANAAALAEVAMGRARRLLALADHLMVERSAEDAPTRGMSRVEVARVREEARLMRERARKALDRAAFRDRPFRPGASPEEAPGRFARAALPQGDPG